MDEPTRRAYAALDLLKGKRFDEAFAALRAVIDEHPECADAWEILGVAYQRAGRLDDAVAAAEELTRRHPDAIMGWVNLSRFLQKQGKIAEAEAAQTKARILGWKADLAAKKGGAGEAPAIPTGAPSPAPQAAAFKPAAPDADRLERMRSLVAQDPKNALARLTYGNQLLAAGRAADAVEQLRGAVDAKPDYSAAWQALGKALEAAGRADDAVSAYRRGVEAAEAKGDLQAKRHMEARLAALAAST